MGWLIGLRAQGDDFALSVLLQPVPVGENSGQSGSAVSGFMSRTTRFTIESLVPSL